MRIRLALSVPTLLFAGMTLCGSPVRAQADADDWIRDCQHNRDRDRDVAFCEVRTTGMAATNETLAANGGDNGGIEVDGWDRDSIYIESRIQTQASTESRAREIAKQIRIVTTGGTIHAEGPGDDDSWAVTFYIKVPRSTNLTLRTENGPISVDDVRSRMDLRVGNGPLDLANIGGDVHARASNGPVTVALSGGKWDGKGLDAETINGPVSLRIPTDYSAQLETGTVNGPMSLGFPVSVTLNGDLHKRFNTTLGQGGATVRVVTTNGPVSIKRR